MENQQAKAYVITDILTALELLNCFLFQLLALVGMCLWRVLCFEQMELFLPIYVVYM